MEQQKKQQGETIVQSIVQFSDSTFMTKSQHDELKQFSKEIELYIEQKYPTIVNLTPQIVSGTDQQLIQQRVQEFRKCVEIIYCNAYLIFVSTDGVNIAINRISCAISKTRNWQMNVDHIFNNQLVDKFEDIDCVSECQFCTRSVSAFQTCNNQKCSYKICKECIIDWRKKQLENNVYQDTCPSCNYVQIFKWGSKCMQPKCEREQEITQFCQDCLPDPKAVYQWCCECYKISNEKSKKDEYYMPKFIQQHDLQFHNGQFKKNLKERCEKVCTNQICVLTHQINMIVGSKSEFVMFLHGDSHGMWWMEMCDITKLPVGNVGQMQIIPLSMMVQNWENQLDVEAVKLKRCTASLSMQQRLGLCYFDMSDEQQKIWFDFCLHLGQLFVEYKIEGISKHNKIRCIRVDLDYFSLDCFETIKDGELKRIQFWETINQKGLSELVEQIENKLN